MLFRFYLSCLSHSHWLTILFEHFMSNLNWKMCFHVGCRKLPFWKWLRAFSKTIRCPHLSFYVQDHDDDDRRLMAKNIQNINEIYHKFFGCLYGNAYTLLTVLSLNFDFPAGKKNKNKVFMSFLSIFNHRCGTSGGGGGVSRTIF